MTKKAVSLSRKLAKLIEPTIEALVDELGQLDQEIAPLEDKKKKAEALRAKLRDLYATKPAADGFAAEGHKFLATIGVMGNERSIDSMVDVCTKVGSKAFLDNCSFTLKKLEDLLKPSDVALLVSTSRTGAREVKTFARSAPK